MKLKALPKRVDKTLQWFEKSRESWKEKTKESKEELKKKTLAVKRAREGRKQAQQSLQKQRRQAQELLIQKDCEIAQLTLRLEKAEQQVEVLKKKNLLRTQANRDFTHTGTV